jgi:hypothetical protein
MDQDSFRQAVELRERLLAELDGNPTFRALQYVEKAIAALQGAKSEPVRPAPAKSAAQSAPRKIRNPPKPGSKTAMIEEAAKAFLRETGRPAHASKICDAIQRSGIHIGGKRPSATVAAYLSHSPDFASDRDAGYSLTEWSRFQTETPNSGTLFGAPKTNGSSPLSP